MFIPTKQQEEAIKLLRVWWNTKNKQVFEISGLAGTGKSALAANFIKEIGLDESQVKFATFTGKAALVLRQRGISNAGTLHSLLYITQVIESELLIDNPDKNSPVKQIPKKDKDGNKIIVKKLFFKERESLDDFKLLVFDECSMINEEMWQLALSHRIPILVLGDNQQLPPIKGDSVLLKNPDVQLTEPVRQAADSGIVQLALAIRNGYKPEVDISDPKRRFRGFNDVVIAYEDELDDGLLLRSDIVICGKNKTRDHLNNVIRKDLLGRVDNFPIDGDKVICRRNNDTELTRGGLALVNGMIGTFKDIQEESYPTVGGKEAQRFTGSFQPDFTEELFEDIKINKELLTSSNLEERQYNLANGSFNKFEHGYCITTHLSQGSEWGKVIVFYEYMGSAEFMTKWLYTAVTRAKSLLILAMPRGFRR